MRTPTDRVSSASTRPERLRRGTTSSWPSLWHLATESAGPSSTPTPISPTPISGCNPEQVIQGRLFDLQGRPAQGVTVSVSRILRILLRDSENSDPQRRRFEGPLYWWARVNDWPAWPKPATTDADGRFSVHGVGRGLQATLSIIDSRFALQMIEVETDNSPDAKSVTMALRPAQIITGRVTYADTGKPVPHAPLIVSARGGGQRGTRPTYFQTDADGRFRANPSPGDEFTVSAAPPAGQPYLGASKSFEWPKGAIEHSLDLSLPRGVLIRGKVTEEGSHQSRRGRFGGLLGTPRGQ